MASWMDMIDMSAVPRRLAFPLPVQALGHIVVDSECYSGVHAGKLEFCFRLRSDDEEAHDRIGERAYSAHFPHLLVKRPSLPHRYEFTRRREAVFLIYPENRMETFESFGICFDDPVLEFRYDEHCRSLFAELLNLFKITHLPGVADELDAKAWLLIQHVYAMGSAFAADPDPVAEDIRRIASYLSTHYAGKIDLARLVGRYGFSLRSFYRHWAKVFDRSPNDMIMELKMKEALRLLENRALPVCRIAGMLRFADSAYFIHCFRKRFKTAPQQYRRMLENGGAPSALHPDSSDPA